MNTQIKKFIRSMLVLSVLALAVFLSTAASDIDSQILALVPAATQEEVGFSVETVKHPDHDFYRYDKARDNMPCICLPGPELE